VVFLTHWIFPQRNTDSKGNTILSSLCCYIPASPSIGELLTIFESILQISPVFSCTHQLLMSMLPLSSDLSKSLHTSFSSLCSGLEEPWKKSHSFLSYFTHTSFPWDVLEAKISIWDKLRPPLSLVGENDKRGSPQKDLRSWGCD
jgi:hypothetical protein